MLDIFFINSRRAIVATIESPSEFGNIAKGMVRDGYSDTEVAKVMGLNGLRVIKACWPK